MKKSNSTLFDYTWSPWQGCSEVSEGCENCIVFCSAQVTAKGTDYRSYRYCTDDHSQKQLSVRMKHHTTKDTRMSHELLYEETPPRPRIGLQTLDFFEAWSGHFYWANSRNIVTCREDGTLIYPKQDEPPGRPVTHADLRLFHSRDMVFCDELDFFISTRRPKNILPMWAEALDGETYVHHFWLGLSASNQREVDEGIDYLLRCRHLVPVLFLQLQPLIGPVVIPRANELDWIIVGAEIGPARRPCETPWVESVTQQARNVNVPCHVTQGSRYHAWKQAELPDHAWSVKDIPVVPELDDG